MGIEAIYGVGIWVQLGGCSLNDSKAAESGVTLPSALVLALPFAPGFVGADCDLAFAFALPAALAFAIPFGFGFAGL